MFLKALYNLISIEKAIERISSSCSDDAKKVIHGTTKGIGRLIKLKYDKRFLINCLRSKMVPKLVSTRIRSANLTYTWPIVNTFICDDVERIDSNIESLHKIIWANMNKLKSALSFFNFLKFLKFIVNVIIPRNKRTHAHEYTKHVNFTQKQPCPPSATSRDSCIKNLSSHVLSNDEEYALSFGLGLPVPSKADWDKCQSGLEETLLDIKPLCSSDNVFDETKKVIAGALVEMRKSKSEALSPLGIKHLKAVNELQKNRSLVLTKFDKGNGVVLMDRSYYVEQMNVILSGSQFKLLDNNDVDKVVKVLDEKVKDVLNMAVKNKELDSGLAHRLKPRGARIPLLYGLPKVHKLDPNRPDMKCPVRPICSMSSSSVDELSEYLNDLIKPALLDYDCYASKGSFDFSEKMRNFEVKKDVEMVSFDVVSLFTNVPLNLAIRIASNVLYDSVYKPNNLKKSTFIKMLQLCVKDIPFLFDQNIYMQTDGVAMGSRLGPTLACLTMAFLEKKVFKSRGLICPLFYTRYVDDIFAVFENLNDAQNFLKCLNLMISQIKFTMENSVSNKLAFLDVLVHNDGDSFSTSIYTKTTSTGLYLNFNACAPINQKRSLIACLIHRILKIASESHRQSDIRNLRGILVKNDYPEHLIKRMIDMTLDKFNKEKFPTVPKKKVFVNIPFQGDDAFKRNCCLIKRTIEKAVNCVKVQMFSSNKKLARPGGKDIVELDTGIGPKSNVVYLYKCSCNATYVGRTSRNLIDRMKEHLPAFLFKCLNSSKSSLSHICSHLLDSPNCITSRSDMFTRFSILAHASNYIQLQYLEAIWIKRLKPVLCVQKQHLYLSL